MKKLRLLIAILMVSSVICNANETKVVILPHVNGPNNIAVDEEKIYITQRATIYIYSRNDYRFIGRFGKKGEGPGEFRLDDDNTVFLGVRSNDLIVNSVGRISTSIKMANS